VRYQGKCEHIHGHNWEAAVTIAADVLDSRGMVIDFLYARACLRAVLKPLDHAYLNELAYFRKRNTTAEEVARYVYDRLVRRVRLHRGARCTQVAVTEMNNARAVYTAPEPRRAPGRAT